MILNQQAKEVSGTNIQRSNSHEMLPSRCHLLIALDFLQSGTEQKEVFKYEPADNISGSSYKIYGILKVLLLLLYVPLLFDHFDPACFIYGLLSGRILQGISHAHSST